MKEMEDTKKSYENIPIPAELSKRVQLEIEKANANQKRKAIHSSRITYHRPEHQPDLCTGAGRHSRSRLYRARPDIPLL